MNCVLKMTNFVLNMMDFALKMKFLAECRGLLRLSRLDKNDVKVKLIADGEDYDVQEVRFHVRFCSAFWLTLWVAHVWFECWRRIRRSHQPSKMVEPTASGRTVAVRLSC